MVAVIVATKLIVTGQLVTGPLVFVIDAFMVTVCAKTGAIESDIAAHRKTGRAMTRI